MLHALSFIFFIFLLNSVCFSSSFGSNLGQDAEVKTSPKPPSGSDRYNNRTNSWLVTSARLVDISDYPYMVAVIVLHEDSQEYYCSGVFLSKPGYVMTAAHCVHDGSKPYLTRYVSLRYDTRHTKSGTAVPTSNIYIHPSYNKEYNEYNIALIRAKNEMAGNLVSISSNNPSLVEKNLRNMEKRKALCTAVGFGLTVGGGGKQDQWLMSVQINLQTIEDCQHMLRESGSGKTASGYMHVCAYTYGTNPCLGSGGQVLICQSLPGALGIFSFGEKCGEQDRPAVFTRVDQGQAFLDTHIRAYRSVKASSYCFQPRHWLIYGILLLGITNY